MKGDKMKGDEKNVNNILLQVDMLIDKALNREERQNLLKSIENNPTYSKLYQQEKEFRSFIKKNLKRQTVSDEFIESLRQFVQKS